MTVETSTTALEDAERSASRRKKVTVLATLVVGFAILVLIGELVPGTTGQIAQNMVKEAIRPGTAAVAIAVIGLNLHFGFTGLLNMGQAGFMLLGAYGFAISLDRGLPLVVGLLVGLLCAVAFALVLGIPTLQLRGDYLAIVTIAAAEIVRYIARSGLMRDITGGSQGIPGKRYREPFTDLSFLGDGQGTVLFLDYPMTGVDGWWVRLVAWTLVAASVAIVFLLTRSPWGRMLRGIREDEAAILSLGKNVFAVKMQSLVIGGMFGALGGIVYILAGSVQADSMGRSLTFFCWTALLLGGAATIFGPVLGTVLFYSVRVFVKGTADAVIPAELMSSTQTEVFSWVIVGVALMLLVIFRPQGILGDKRELRFNV